MRWQEGPGATGSTKTGAGRTGAGKTGAGKTGGGKGNRDLPYGPYLQSKRHSIYEAAFRTLLRRGYLYPCYCSRKELALAATAPHEGGQPHGAEEEPVYPGTCRHLIGESGQLPGPTASRFAPQTANWRFRVNDGLATEFVDQHLGAQRFVAGVDFGDFLVWRKDSVPSYQLACAVDDAAMKITEVVRGADLLRSTARQILLLKALGYGLPDWFHATLIADHNGQRLAKRHDALSLRALRARGAYADEYFFGGAAGIGLRGGGGCFFCGWGRYGVAPGLKLLLFFCCYEGPDGPCCLRSATLKRFDLGGGGVSPGSGGSRKWRVAVPFRGGMRWRPIWPAGKVRLERIENLQPHPLNVASVQ